MNRKLVILAQVGWAVLAVAPVVVFFTVDERYLRWSILVIGEAVVAFAAVLFRNASASEPVQPWMAANSEGLALFEAGRFDDSEPHFARAARLLRFADVPPTRAARVFENLTAARVQMEAYADAATSALLALECWRQVYRSYDTRLVECIRRCAGVLRRADRIQEAAHLELSARQVVAVAAPDPALIRALDAKRE